jgi:hypothetical protein
VVSKVDKSVPYEFNNCNIFDPDIYYDPFIFLVLFQLVNPDTFNDEINVTLLFKIAEPLTSSDDNDALPLTVNSFKFEQLLTF